jgi:hypothetical protein
MTKLVAKSFVAMGVGAFLLAAPPLSGTASAAFDHLKCYKVADLRPLAGKTIYTMDLYAHEFHTFAPEIGCKIKNKAFLLCIDVDKQNVVPPPPYPFVRNAANAGDYICYKFIAAPGCAPSLNLDNTVQVQDQFNAGNMTVKRKKPFMVCAPALKAQSPSGAFLDDFDSPL